MKSSKTLSKTASSLKHSSTKLTRPRRKGSAVVMYMLMLSTVITGTVASVAVLSNAQTQTSTVAFDRDQAFYAAEAGVQRAIWNLNHNAAPATWLASLPLTGTLAANGSTFKITAGAINWPTAPVTFQCLGYSKDNTVTSQASVTISQSTSTSSGFSPGFAMGGSDTFSGTLNIAGTFETTGSIVGSGAIKLTNVAGQPNASLESKVSIIASGTLNVPGNLVATSGIVSSGSAIIGGNVQAGGTVSHSGTWNVIGTTTANNNPGLPFTAIPTVDTSVTTGLASGKFGTMQQITGTTGTSTPLSSLTLNFANNPVIQINGDLITGPSTVITIIPPASGSGTLVVTGKMTCATSLGSSSAPVAMNIVTSGNLSQSGTQYINGSIYCGAAMTVAGNYNVKGCVVVTNGINGSGILNLSYVAPPSYINFAGNSVGSTSNSVVTASNFMGPMY
jgi:trimeric autotransporter adhesin